jgi:hypothetical protein
MAGKPGAQCVRSANRISAAIEPHEFVSMRIRTKAKKIRLKEIEIEERGMSFQALADGPQEAPLPTALACAHEKSGLAKIERKPRRP